VALSDTQWHSGTQWHSVSLSINQYQSVSTVLHSPYRPNASSRGRYGSSELISTPQWPSTYLRTQEIEEPRHRGRVDVRRHRPAEQPTEQRLHITQSVPTEGREH